MDYVCMYGFMASWVMAAITWLVPCAEIQIPFRRPSNVGYPLSRSFDLVSEGKAPQRISIRSKAVHPSNQ
jgi:hypothetical protein